MGNTEIAINHLQLLVLSDEQVAEANIDYTELIEVRLGDEVFAPIWMASLKTHLKHFPTEGELLEVIAFQSNDKWCELYIHHYFQRREKPSQHLKNKGSENYHIQKDGQVIGPFSFDEIKQKLSSIELLTTDIVSSDGGRNWSHLYQIDKFDRRDGKPIAPPSAPDDQVMIPTHDDIQKRIDQLGKNFSETEAVAGLAYIGNLQTGKAIGDENWEKLARNNRDSKKIVKEKTKSNFKINLNQKNSKYTSLFVFSILGLLALYATWDWGSTPELAETKSKEIKQQKKVARSLRKKVQKPARRAPASVKKVNPFKKAPKASPFKKKTSPFKKSSRRSIIKSNTSFTKSKSFNKMRQRTKSLSDNPFKRNTRFDDGTDPVENDPVRSQVSKETLDPVDYDN